MIASEKETLQPPLLRASRTYMPALLDALARHPPTTTAT
jgi:hypothetical protein